jgi:hypothetical protein
MKSWITDFYKKAGTTPGQSKLADDVASTVSNTYFNKSTGLGNTVSTGTNVAAGAEAGGLLSTAVSAATSLLPAGKVVNALKVAKKI